MKRDRSIRIRRRVTGAACGALLFVASALAAPAGAAAGTLPDTDIGPPVDEGSVIVTAPDGTPLAGGGSATPFTVVLPDGVTCPGDSASDDWRVQSFMIPADDDPGTIKYGFAGPEGTQFPLFAADTRPYAEQLLPVNAGPGQPARIPAVPPLTFTIFPPDAIALGKYRIGIACAYFRVTAKYWDTEIVLTPAEDDEPSQFVWSVVDPPTNAVDGSSLDRDSSPSKLLLALGAIAAVGAGATLLLFAVRRRRVTAPPPSSGVRR